jgi:hypothetical protein
MDIEESLSRLQDLTMKIEKYGKIRGNTAGSAVGSPMQGMQGRLREILALVVPGHDLSHLLVMDVGDRLLAGTSENGYDIGFSLPVASDIWYLSPGDSILPFKGDNHQANAEKILGFLEEYLARLDNIKPLKILRQPSDLHAYKDWSEMRNAFDADKAPYAIREMRFETWMLNRSTEFPSKGPKASAGAGEYRHPENSLGQLYCGLLSFPVGPLGVMEVLSIFSESMDAMHFFSTDESIIVESPDSFECVTDQPLDGFMSPMTDMKGKCPGVHLVEKGYLNVSRDAEYPAEPFDGHDLILPFHSLRFYLRRDAKWPLPGEFIGLLAKPWPTHVWWFQKTSPLLYAGNWFETNYYTSGVITEVLTPLEGSSVKVYKCVVRGVEICIASSDFYGYAVGDRVAILRTADLDRETDKTKGNFKWKEMEDLFAREKREKEIPSNAEYVINGNMLIIPMSFYTNS